MASYLVTRSKEEKRCGLVGIANLVLASVGTTALFSLICIELEDHTKPNQVQKLSKLHHYFGNISQSSLLAILGTAVVVSLGGIAASILVLVGITFQKSCFLITYFCFGLLTTILSFVSGALFLAYGHWYVAFVMVLVPAFSICSMVIVYRGYESMESNIRYASFEHDTRLLITEDE